MTYRYSHVLVVVFLFLLACHRECSDSLAAEFSRAQFARETWLIDLGMPDYRPSLVSGWGKDERWGPQRVSFVWGTHAPSVIRVNRYGTAAVRLRFRCAPNGEQEVTTVVNGVAVATTPLAGRFAVYDIAISGARFRLGENLVEFRYRDQAPVAWDWIEILEPHAKPNLRTPKRENDTLVLPYRSALRIPLEVMPQSALVMDAIEVQGELASTVRDRIVFTIRSATGQQIATFDSSSSDDRPKRFQLPLQRRARVVLEIAVLEPQGGAPAATAVKLRNIRIVHQCR
jgi:hypothetical protein